MNRGAKFGTMLGSKFHGKLADDPGWYMYRVAYILRAGKKNTQDILDVNYSDSNLIRDFTVILSIYQGWERIRVLLNRRDDPSNFL